jgi:hypothetical protein
MMFKVATYKKYLKSDSKNPIPDNWYDFCCQLNIRSAGKIVKFIPYRYQIEIISAIENGNTIICKSRQLGISEIILAYMLFCAVKNPGYLALIVSKSQRDTSLLARRIKRMIEGYSGQIKTVTDNISDIEIQSGGRLLFGNSNPDSYRGIESVNHVFIDEFSFIEDAQEIRNCIKPSQLMLGKNAREILVSTPNGKNNEFYNILNSGNNDINLERKITNINSKIEDGLQIWKDDNNWNKCLISWLKHPIYGNNPKFLADIKNSQKLSDDIINQEYNLSFLDSDKMFFGYKDIRDNFTLLKNDFEVNSDYYFGIDASGFGGDFTVCVIFKKVENTFSMVNFYRKNNQSTEYHLAKISDLISQYNPKCVAIEVTGGTGQVWFESLVNEFFTIKFKPIKTTQESKLYMSNRFKYLLESGKIKGLNNNIIKDEFLNFNYNLEGSNNSHDDIVMASFFAILGAS